MPEMRKVIFLCKRNKRKTREVGGEEMKYLKSFLGCFIAFLIALIIVAPIFAFILLGALINLWFFIGLIFSIPWCVMSFIFFSNHFDWVYDLMTAFDE